MLLLDITADCRYPGLRRAKVNQTATHAVDSTVHRNHWARNQDSSSSRSNIDRSCWTLPLTCQNLLALEWCVRQSGHMVQPKAVAGIQEAATSMSDIHTWSVHKDRNSTYVVE